MGAAGRPRRASRWWALLLALSPASCAAAAAATTRRLKATVLSWNPRLVAYENFLSDEEVDELRKEAENQTFLRTALIGRDGFFVKGSTITSRIANMPESHSGYVVRRRIADTTQLPVEFQEPTRVLRYNSSDFFRGHIDAHALSGRFSSTRTATFFVYLNDVADGGETHFPLAVPVANVSKGRGFVREGPASPHCAHLVSKESSQGGIEAEYIDGYDLLEGRGAKLNPPMSRRGLSIVPRKGLAILWYSRRPDGQLDPSSQHVGCPVRTVDRLIPEHRFKYSLTTWIHFEPPKYELMEDAPFDMRGAFLSLGRPRGAARGAARLRPSQDRFDGALLGGWLGRRGRRGRAALVQRGSADSAPADGNATATAAQRLESALARLAAEERSVSFTRARLERLGAEPAADAPGSRGPRAARSRAPREAESPPRAAEGPAEALQKAAALRGAKRAAGPPRAAEPAVHQAAQHRDLSEEPGAGESLRRVMERDEEELERELGLVGAGYAQGALRQALGAAGAAAHAGPSGTGAASHRGHGAAGLDEARSTVGELARLAAPGEARSAVGEMVPLVPGAARGGPNGTRIASRPVPAGAAREEARSAVGEMVPPVPRAARGGPNGTGTASRPVPAGAARDQARSAVGEMVPPVPGAARGGPNGTGTASRPMPAGAARDQARSAVGEMVPPVPRAARGGPNGTGTASRPVPAGAAREEARSAAGEMVSLVPGAARGGPNGTGTASRPVPAGAARGQAAARAAEGAARHNGTSEERVAHRSKLKAHHHHRAKKVGHNHKRHHREGLHSSVAANPPKVDHHHEGQHEAGLRSSAAADAPKVGHNHKRHHREGLHSSVAANPPKVDHHHEGQQEAGLRSSAAADAPKVGHDHKRHHREGLHSSVAANPPKVDRHHEGQHEAGLRSSAVADAPKAPACVDVAPAGAEKWHDADGPQYDCFFYAQGDGCKLYGRRFHKFNLTAADACCACGGGRWSGQAAEEAKILKLQAENERLQKEIERLRSQVGLLDEDVRQAPGPDAPDDWSESDLVDWAPCPAWQNSTCAVHWDTSPDSSVGLAGVG